MNVAAVPKAELHCHIEGAIPPDLAHQIANRNGIVLAKDLFDRHGSYAWHDFASFLTAYDGVSACLRHPVDYRDVMYRYLSDCAEEGAVYVEVFSSPDHAEAAGIGYEGHLAGLAAGIDDACRDFGIVGRVIVTCVRHFGPDQAMRVVRRILAEPHPYVVGFGMGGDETQFRLEEFVPAFFLAADSGLSCTVHAGEIVGPGSVRDAIRLLPISRIGHGIRASEDPVLIKDIVRRGITLEVCPGSNLALGLYPDYRSHPLPRLLDAGVRVTLNSDDPPFFQTSIGREYASAAERFGLDANTLAAITDVALAAAFGGDDLMKAIRQGMQTSKPNSIGSQS
jgi:adenosine deaminase